MMSLLLPSIALAAGQALDTGSTLHALAHDCHEGNAIIYSAAPSPTRLITQKAATVAGAAAVMWVLTRQHHPKAAAVVGLFGGATGAFAGGWNLRQCGGGR